MPKIRVQTAANSVEGEIEKASAAIRRRAFELFQKRGGNVGHELDDWLQAERDLYFVPHAEVNENASEFRMMVHAPGFYATDIEVLATSLELLIEAKAERRLEPTRQNPTAGSLEFRSLYRRFGFGSPVDAEHVTARIDEGCLTIEAPKKISGPVRARSTAA